MFARRRQAASPVSLLAVTWIFVWACSSGSHNEDSSVTASGGAGSNVAVGRGPSGEAGTSFEGGAPAESGSAPPSGFGGSEVEPSEVEPEPTGGTGAVLEVGSGNVSTGGAQPEPEPESRAGGESAGGRNVGGAPASAGNGAGGVTVFEPSCEPTTGASIEVQFLPCEVTAAFSVCRTCHSNPPVKSVNRSYVTYQDIQPMAAQIYGVVKSGYMPWPPSKLAPDARNIMLTWLGKDGSCAVGVARACE